MFRLTVFAWLLVMPLAAQVASFDFSALAEKAKAKTEVNMDRAAMDALKVQVKDAGPLSRVESVSVHAYEYAQAGDFPAGALEPLRKQIAADKRWSKLVSAKDGDESSDIYMRTEGGKLAGLLVIAQEPKEVTVVEINGSVEMAQLQEVVKSAIEYDIASAGNVGK